MAINPTAAAYITNQPDTNAAVVDIDIKGAENDSNRTSGRALVVTISGTLNADGSYSPGFAGGGGGGGTFNGQVQGNVASGATDAGNPVKVGGVVSSTTPAAATDGTRINAWYLPRGQAAVTLVDGASGVVVTQGRTLGADGMSSAPTNILMAQSYNVVYNGTSYDRQRGDTNGTYMVSKGSGSIATAQVSVGTAATQIVAARAGRGSVKITNLGTTDVFIGIAGVTATTGDLLPGTKGASITIPSNAAIFGVAGTAQSVSVMEVF